VQAVAALEHHPVALLELDQTDVAPRGQRILRRDHHEELLPAEPADRAGPVDRRRADAQIARAAADRVLGKRAVRELVQADERAGVALAPGLHEVGQDAGGDRANRADLELAGLEVEGGASGLLRPLGGSHRGLGVRKEGLAGRGQPHRARKPLQQLAADLLLQRADLLRERGLRDVHAQRRPRERALLDDREPVGDPPEASHCPSLAQFPIGGSYTRRGQKDLLATPREARLRGDAPEAAALPIRRSTT
jgi:hypothetical protein